MPDFELERTGADRPVCRIPASGAIAANIPPVEVYLKVGKVVSGCYICRRPIPAGTTRVGFKVHFGPDYDPVTDELVPPKRQTGTYNVHPGCLTKPMGSEIKRHGLDCFDCGASGAQAGQSYVTASTGWEHVFTTHRFAWGTLCPKCQEKPKWLSCGQCAVWFPQHMVFYGSIDDPKRAVARAVVMGHDTPRQHDGDWCVFCADRWGIPSPDQRKEATNDFEQTKRLIMQSGVFGGDDGD